MQVIIRKQYGSDAPLIALFPERADINGQYRATSDGKAYGKLSKAHFLAHTHHLELDDPRVIDFLAVLNAKRAKPLELVGAYGGIADWD